MTCKTFCFSLIIFQRDGVRKMYSNVLHENKALITELDKRSTNHKQLLASLRLVNNMINKAANLRCNFSGFFVGLLLIVGKYKSKVVSLCRNAIKTNNMYSLI